LKNDDNHNASIDNENGLNIGVNNDDLLEELKEQ